MEGLHPVHRQGAQKPGERQKADCERHFKGLRPQVPAGPRAPSAILGALLLWREPSLLGSYGSPLMGGSRPVGSSKCCTSPYD